MDAFGKFLERACAVSGEVLSMEDKSPDEHGGDQTSDEPEGNNNTDLGEGGGEMVGGVDDGDTDADVGDANTNSSDSESDMDDDANGVTDINTGTTAPFSNVAIFTMLDLATPSPSHLAIPTMSDLALPSLSHRATPTSSHLATPPTPNLATPSTSNLATPQMSNLATLSSDCRPLVFHSHLAAQPMYPSDSAGLHLLADHVPGMYPDGNLLSELNTWGQLFKALSLPQCSDFGNPSLLSNIVMQPFMSMDFSGVYSASSFDSDLNQFGAFGALDLSGDCSVSQAINNQPLSPIHSSSSTLLSGLPSDLDTQLPHGLLPTLPAPIDHDHHDNSLLGHSKQKSIRSQRAERDNAIGKENNRQKLKADKRSAKGDPVAKGAPRNKKCKLN